MTPTPDSPETQLSVGIGLVDDFFDGILEPLNAWRPRLEAQLRERLSSVGRLDGSQVLQFVEDDALRILAETPRPLYGAGYCAGPHVVSGGNPLAWWQGPTRSPLAASTFGPGQAAIDLFRLEWYRVPEASGQPHVAGPFVDYLCSNEITITTALPVYVEEMFAGVICADVLVVELEDALLPALTGIPSVTLMNTAGRVVVSQDLGLQTGDRVPSDLMADGGTLSRADSTKYPFALVITA